MTERNHEIAGAEAVLARMERGVDEPTRRWSKDHPFTHDIAEIERRERDDNFSAYRTQFLKAPEQRHLPIVHVPVEFLSQVAAEAGAPPSAIVNADLDHLRNMSIDGLEIGHQNADDLRSETKQSAELVSRMLRAHAETVRQEAKRNEDHQR